MKNLLLRRGQHKKESFKKHKKKPFLALEAGGSIQELDHLRDLN